MYVSRQRITVLAVAFAITALAGLVSEEARAAGAHARACERVRFPGVFDFQLTHIRAIGVRCVEARKVVRGARLHTRWRSHGFACRVVSYDPEVATFFRCTKGPHRRITFRT